jgi:carbohydrate-binding DOMON domain-containing protein
MAMFVEEVKTLKIKESIDKLTYDGADVSVSSCNPYQVAIVIGALWKDRCACMFSKKGLGKLIEDLQAIYDVMEN